MVLLAIVRARGARRCSATCAQRRRVPVQRGMNPVGVVVVVGIELFQLPAQIGGISEDLAIEIFSTNCSDEPFDEWMRYWKIRDGS